MDLNQHKENCSISKTQLFIDALYQNDILVGYWEQINRVDTGSGSRVVKFNIKGNNHYIDLPHCYLILKIKVTKEDNSDLDDNVEIAPINLIGATIFSQLKVYFKETAVLVHPNYMYAAYMQTEYTFSKNAKQSWLQGALYYKDTPGQMDAISNLNQGFQKRKIKVAKSRSIEICTKIHSSIFSQDKILLNNLDMCLEFDRTKDSFCLMAPEGTSLNLKIEEAKLMIRRCTLSTEADLKIQKQLESSNIRYHIPRYIVTTHSLTTGLYNKQIGDFTTGDLPTRILVGLIGGDAYAGKLNKNPFNFKHFDLSSVDILVNGKSAFGKLIPTNFENKQYQQLYTQTMICLGHYGSDGCDISVDDFDKGYTVFGADLTSSLCSGDDYRDPANNGNLEIALTFSKALPETVDCIIYLEFENTIDITAAREVIKDFA